MRSLSLLELILTTKTMKYEPTQKGNPHQLTVKQHIFPNRSISRFCNENDAVDLLMLDHRSRKSLKPDNAIFCTLRSWDEHTEKALGKGIEDAFQAVVEKILQSESIDSEDNLVLNSFYCLYKARRYWSRKEMEDENLGLVPEIEFNLDEQEELEKANVCFIRPDGTITRRTMRGLMMKMNLLDCRRSMSGVKWGVIKASEGEFLVPDNFPDGCIPVNPRLFLAAGLNSQTIELHTLQEVNSRALSSAEKYLFARDLKECPTVSNDLSNLLQSAV